MMKIMALKILREIAATIKDSDFCAMMCDELTDAETHLRWSYVYNGLTKN